MSRPTLGTTYMMLALTWAMRSTCTARASVGAVLVSPDGRVIAAGYNGSPHGQPHCDAVGCEMDSSSHCKRAIHAEENVILQCATHGVSTANSTIYVTHKPCERCSRRLLQANVIRAFYLFEYGEPYDTGFTTICVRDEYEMENLNELLLEIRAVFTHDRSI